VARRRREPAAAPDPDLANLRKINHVVVLMLENRSFDHMLGYLKLEAGRPDVEGLDASMSNMHRGKRYKVRHLQRTALTRDEDPPHGGASIAEQVSGNMGGFVSNFARERPRAKLVDIPMGYYNGSDLPVYDHLAREFCVCDHWFCSVPGATWPNRLYAVAGQAAGSKDGRRVPIYDLPSFVRHLETNKVRWRWYSHDVGTLRFSDGRFRLGYLDKFAYFDRRSLLAPRNFLDDAKDGRLPAVSWIDPNFVDVSFIGPSGSNDDHPPSDIKEGQELVLKTYTALVKSPQWKKTMLIVTYDEHGGFFDHVQPPPAEDDRPAFRTYGVRVPALVVSPFTERASVSKVTYDHTSIIKTILLRFCRKNGQIPNMGARVAKANHLGATLRLAQPRPPTPSGAFRDAVDRITAWRADVFRSRVLMEPLTTPADPRNLTDLQEQVLAAKKRIRAQGLPEGQP
jgi:phospholipase C